jgi:hypothetical protein
MAVFGFDENDLLANREGRITGRQRLRMLLREGSVIGAVAVGSLLVGVSCGSVCAWGVLNPGQVPLHTRVNGDLQIFGAVGLFALVVFVATIALGWSLVKDVLRGVVHARSGDMRVTHGIARVTYYFSGRPPAPLLRHGTESKFDISLSDRAYAKLSADAPERFLCTVYRTEGGLRILSVGTD